MTLDWILSALFLVNIQDCLAEHFWSDATARSSSGDPDGAGHRSGTGDLVLLRFIPIQSWRVNSGSVRLQARFIGEPESSDSEQKRSGARWIPIIAGQNQPGKSAQNQGAQ
jgi:hypothetical protein